MALHLGGRLRALAGTVLGLLVPTFAAAQHITTDGTLSPAQTLVGPNYSITSNLGRQVGGNLFHSFGIFGLATGESATFSGPGGIANVIGRVTGGSASSVNGAIKSTVPNANLYLINPAGVVFGPNATVSVPGSFHTSTADYLRLSDGARFQATNPGGSTLSAAAPAAFGFLTATPGQITVNAANHTVLGVNSGQTLDLVGGPVSIQNTNPPPQLTASLTAPSGTIRVVSAAGPGEVSVDPANTAATTVTTFGAVSLSGNLDLDVSDVVHKTSGGSILIRAGTLTMSGGLLDATNYGATAGGQIAIDADAQIALSNGAKIQAPGTAAGRGADILLTTGPAGSISASGPVVVDVGTVSTNGGGPSAATGGSGQITVTTGTLSLTGGAIIGSDVNGSGPTGPISINAGTIMLDGSGSTATSSLTGFRARALGGTANAADISVNAGTLTILANGEVITSTSAAGNAGHVTVGVTGLLSVDATAALVSTGIGSVAAQGSTGNSGDVTVAAGGVSLVGTSAALAPSPAAPASQPFAGLSAQTRSAGLGGNLVLNAGGGGVTMSDGAVVSASASSSGSGGSVTVMAEGPLTVTGAATAITAAALPGSSGNAGSVTVEAPQITLQSGAQIVSTTGGTGAGGAVDVTTPGALLIDGMGVAGTEIAASATGPQSGPGGAVAVTAGSLSLQNGGAISSTTAGPGIGGNVGVVVAGDANLAGTGSGISAAATAGSTGAAGAVALSVGGGLNLSSGAQISSATSGAGNGGTVALSVGGALNLSGGAQISSATFAAGNGGTVTVSAAGPLSLSGIGTGITASAGSNASGNAGAVSVSAPEITVQSGAQIASTTAGTGSGGAVDVTTPGSLVIDGMGVAGTQIAASATGPQSGPGGDVAIQAASLTMQNGGTVASSTAGPGRGGNIDVSIGSGVVLSGAGPQITARSSGSGDAGSITLSAATLNLSGGAAISTEAAFANGGNIALHIGQSVFLVDSDISTSVHGQSGNGGNILIDPQTLVLQRSSIVAQAVQGHGGNITIVADEFLPSADSIVSASSQLGISGTVEIVGPRVDLNGTLVVLASELRSAAQVLRNSCAARSALPRSSLTSGGRGGLPQDPEATVPALYLADREPARTAGAAAEAPRAMPRSATHVGALRLAMHCG